MELKNIKEKLNLNILFKLPINIIVLLNLLIVSVYIFGKIGGFNFGKPKYTAIAIGLTFISIKVYRFLIAIYEKEELKSLIIIFIIPVVCAGFIEILFGSPFFIVENKFFKVFYVIFGMAPLILPTVFLRFILLEYQIKRDIQIFYVLGIYILIIIFILLLYLFSKYILNNLPFHLFSINPYKPWDNFSTFENSIIKYHTYILAPLLIILSLFFLLIRFHIVELIYIFIIEILYFMSFIIIKLFLSIILFYIIFYLINTNPQKLKISLK